MIFAWFMLRDSLLILSGVFLVVAEHQGWAALMFLLYLIILGNSFRTPGDKS